MPPPPRVVRVNPGAPTQISPAANAPNARDPLEEEAFFPDEASSVRTQNGLRENIFKNLGVNRTFRTKNPLLDPLVANSTDLTATEIQKLRTFQSSGLDEKYHIYLPVHAFPPFKVTVLFAVGTEIRRHGLRLFFNAAPGRVLVLAPGIEGSFSVVKPIGRAWGVGVTKSIVEKLLERAGHKGASFTVDVLAAYSTGYRGLNGTINNWATDPATMDLRKVKDVILYDCLYRGDEPAPGLRTRAALQAIDNATSRAARLAVYEVTDGTRRVNGDTLVPQAWLRSTFSGRYELKNLKPSARGLAALIYARMFHAAVKDGYFGLSSLPIHLQNLIAQLPKRGDIASTLPLASYRPSTHTTMSVASWAAANSADVNALQKDWEPLRKAVIADPRFKLMGWRPPGVDRVFHDGFIPEFAWEFLRG